MANTNSSLLTRNELTALYGLPNLNENELSALFCLTEEEKKILYGFDILSNAIYFSISLVFFKVKSTLVSFKYRDVTFERQYVMRKYFKQSKTPRSFPTDKDTIKRIENKVLKVLGYARFDAFKKMQITSLLQNQAASYPRQRQMCRQL